MQNEPVQPAPTPASTPPQMTPQTPAPIPGKALGIVGFIMAFVGLQLVGLILSIISFNKAKKVGVKNSLALAGIIVNAVFLALAIVMIPILVGAMLASYNAISDRANTTAAQAAATEVIKKAELYSLDNGTYPATTEELSSSAYKTDSTITFINSGLTTEPEDPSTVAFYDCGEDGNKVGYWNYEDGVVEYVGTTYVTASSLCVIAP